MRERDKEFKNSYRRLKNANRLKNSVFVVMILEQHLIFICSDLQSFQCCNKNRAG